MYSCAPPVSYVIEVAYAPELKKTVSPSTTALSVGVIPFTDERSDRKAIGERIHLTGKVDRFAPEPSPADRAVTQALVTALKIHGYQPELFPAGTSPDAVSGKDAVISGSIKDLWAVAQSRPGYTDIKAKVHLEVNVYRPAERKTFTIDAKSVAQSKVVLFSPSDLEKTVNDALTDAIDDLLSNRWFSQ